MTCGLDEVQARVDAIINDFCPVDAVLLFEIRVKSRFDVFNDGFPAENWTSKKDV